MYHDAIRQLGDDHEDKINHLQALYEADEMDEFDAVCDEYEITPAQGRMLIGKLSPLPTPSPYYTMHHIISDYISHDVI